MRVDFQHQIEKVQDFSAHLQHLLLISVEFNNNFTMLEDVLGHHFYNEFRPSIKLEIDKVDRQQLFWDNFVITANIAKSKTRIHNSQYLNLRCLRDKQLLKLVLKKSWKQQVTEKSQFKALTLELIITLTKPVKGSQQSSKSAKKTRKWKKKNQYQKKRKKRS